MKKPTAKRFYAEVVFTLNKPSTDEEAMGYLLSVLDAPGHHLLKGVVYTKPNVDKVANQDRVCSKCNCLTTMDELKCPACNSKTVPFGFGFNAGGPK